MKENEIYLTQPIDNDKGYIDSVIDQIKAVPDGEALVMLITCVGGDTFQGERINYTLTERHGETKAIVIGLAASMAGVNLSAFDSVEIDQDAQIMLHKAHVPDMEEKDLSPEQKKILDRFNSRAYSKMKASGVDEAFLNKVFLSDNTDDHWLTAEEAEAVGIGKVVKLERRDGRAFKVAATLDLSKIKNEYKTKKEEMSIFKSKDKAVARVVALADGRKIIFSSVDEEVKVKDTVQLVGSNESLSGRIQLENKSFIVLNELNEVEEVEDAPEEEFDGAAIAQRITDIEQSIAGILAKIGESEESDEEVEAKAEADEEKEKEMEAKADDAAEAVNAAKALLEDTLKVAATLKTSMKLNKGDNKNEAIQSSLTGSEARAAGMRDILNETKDKE